ncbi:MAG: ATP-binding protein [Tannerella sp.]|jgi:predicted AAA+ superfamily ATPase|nr:ATP-binding protein [Tannerella sp.]
MYRNKINALKEWKLKKSKKPLVFLGARQVGHTWLIKEFGKNEFRQMLYVNFDDKDAPRNMFLQNFDIKRLITELQLYSGLKITPEDTLIVFDEIQSAPQGITSLKYFNENAPEYQIIAAGSLLGINIHPNESFPVGKVEFLQLYPMSFYEFVLAMDEIGLAQILEEKLWDYSPTFAGKMKEFLRYYFFVGGMPEAVLRFSQNRDWNEVRKIQLDILKSYESDFSKHAPRDILPRINLVWKSIPAQLAKENRKFFYGVIKEGARAREYEMAIQWLIDSGLLHKIYSVSKPALPLAAYQDLSAFKIFHNDTGLLAAMSNLNAKTLLNGDTVFTEFKGALAEQFVFQQLLLNEKLSVHYFQINNRLEIDFVIQNEDDEIIPVEVKSGENLSAKSLKHYAETYQPATAIRTSLANYQKENRLTNVPLYLIGNYFN